MDAHVSDECDHEWRFNGGNTMCSACGAYREGHQQRVFNAVKVDDGEAAIQRERDLIQGDEEERIARSYLHTDAEREAFRAKLQAWRESKGIPGYIGPRAAK